MGPDESDDSASLSWYAWSFRLCASFGIFKVMQEVQMNWDGVVLATLLRTMDAGLLPIRAVR